MDLGTLRSRSSPIPRKTKKMKGAATETEMLKLRSAATELLLRENWNEYINLYSRFISLCYFPHISPNNEDEGEDEDKREDEEEDANNSAMLQRACCSAFSNRAEAHFRLRNFCAALIDCNHALGLDPSHLKSLICKGKLLLDLHCYAQASDCFLKATALSCADSLSQLLKRSQKLDSQSKTGSVDLSDWVFSNFDGECPELAEFVGPIEIQLSEAGGRRGLFATRGVHAGTPLFITKAVVLGRGILPKTDGGETARMVMWKDFVDKILDVAQKCSRTRALLSTLFAGDIDGGDLIVPKIELFKPESAADTNRLSFFASCNLDMERILKVLDFNCLTEESVSAKAMGKKKGCCSVGLWFLPSFMNHSCCPNSRLLHVGDRVIVHASRDIKAGEEITFAYFDVLKPLNERREMARRWGFLCSCARCRFEEGKEMELTEFMSGVEGAGDLSVNAIMERVEDRVKKWALKGKEKGFLRASFWASYSNMYKSEKMKGKRIPPEISVAGSIFDALGGDERVLMSLARRLKNGGRFGNGIGAEEMEMLMKMARRVYGKVMKMQAMKAFLELELASMAS